MQRCPHPALVARGLAPRRLENHIHANEEAYSVVSAVWNEEENVIPCYEAVKKVFEVAAAQYDYEHIFCDNASSDRTLDLLKEIAGER